MPITTGPSIWYYEPFASIKESLQRDLDAAKGMNVGGPPPADPFVMNAAPAVFPPAKRRGRPPKKRRAPRPWQSLGISKAEWLATLEEQADG